MQAITDTTAQARHQDAIDRVRDGREPVILTRDAGQPVVRLSLDHYKALNETAHLPRTPYSNCATLPSRQRVKR